MVAPHEQSHRASRIVVCVAGGIAAFKAPMLVRELMRRGYEVRVAMTEAATKFVGAATFSGITGRQPLTEMWSQDGEPHILLSGWADAIVVAPCSADLLAKIRQGLAGDAVTATLLSFAGPVLVAPGMHTRMWQHPSTVENVAVLRARQVLFCGPEVGALASGDHGVGRMAEPSVIADALDLLCKGSGFRSASLGFDLEGKHILVSAGPTHEPIDPVRFIGNRSSGKMGYSVAQAALARGARVTLVSGPAALTPPEGVRVLSVKTAVEMKDALFEALHKNDVDALVMTAAVADYRVENPASEKRKKKQGKRLTLELVETADILAEIGAWRAQSMKGTPLLVGFALETENLIEAAKSKLARKRVDLIVANLAAQAFEGDSNEATLVRADEILPLPKMQKRELADAILSSIFHR